MTLDERLDIVDVRLAKVETKLDLLIKAVDLHNARHFTVGLEALLCLMSALVAIGIALFRS